ncbi:hypothetical protein ACFE04_023041 [Oxalis oulophora]
MDIGHKSKLKGSHKTWNPALLVQLPHKLKISLQSQLRRLAKDNGGLNFGNAFTRKEKVSSVTLESDLEKQLQPWRENPSWDDQPPQIKVSVPKGSLCNLRVKVDVGLPPDAVYNIVTDPDNKRVFKNIQEVTSRNVLVDEGHRQVVDLEQAAIWRFLWWSGTIKVHVLVDQNRKDHTMKFSQVETGFMEKFEGCWRVSPLFVDEKMCFPFKPKTFADYQSCTKGKGRIGSTVTLDQLVQPAIVPPPPISWYLRGITAKTSEMLVNDLLVETARIRGDPNCLKFDEEFENPQGTSDECLIDQITDIKERWAIRRKNAKQYSRRLSQV